MLEMICPQCGGPAIQKSTTEISCGLCGDFVHGFDEQMSLYTSRSLLEQLPDPLPEQKCLDLAFSETEAKDFPGQIVSLRLPRRFRLAEHCNFEVTVERALEFFFGFLEAYEAIPDVPSTLVDSVQDCRLLSSQAFRLQKLANQAEMELQQLCELALELYTMNETS